MEQKPPEAKPAESKPTEQQQPAAPTEQPPLTVEQLTAPEGVDLSTEENKALVEGFLGVMNDKTLSRQDLANKLVGTFTAEMQKAAERLSDNWTQQNEAWVNETKADPEIGGAKFDENLGIVRRAVEMYFPPEAKQIFDITGAGNNPHIIKGLLRMAKAAGEGGPTPGGGPTERPKTAAESFYPTMGA